MFRHKFLNLIFSMMVVSSLLFGGSGTVLAKAPKPPNGNGKGHGNGQMRTTTVAARKAARLQQAPQQVGVSQQYAGLNPDTAAFSTLAQAPSLAPMSAPFSQADYFGVANWANSPLPTITTSGTTTNSVVGNALIDRAYATDFATPPGTLGPVFVVLGNAKLPAGNLINFQVENQATTGGSPTPSAGNVFQAFVLRPTGTANQYTVIYASPVQTVPALAVAGTSEIDTYTPTGLPVAVQANDVIAFYGEGVPVDTGGLNADTLSYPAPAAPAQGTTITLGVDVGFPLFSTDRTYSFSATVSVTSVTSTITGGMHKFVDTLPPLCALGKNDLGQCIPIAVPDTTTFPGSDYYEIEVGQYQEQLHFDLPKTTLRGYRQTNTTDPNASVFHYLGPLIIAQGCEPHSTSGATCSPHPVRVKFTNSLPTGPAGDLFIPVDTTYMGAGMGPQGVITRVVVGNGGSGYTTAPAVTIAAPPAGGIQAIAVATIAGGIVTGIMVTNEGAGYPAGSNPAVTIAPPTSGVQATASAVVPLAGEMYTENRSTLHLHGGNTPWISDGTPHQWVVPATENTSYKEGLSQRNVPDMWFDATGVLIASCSGQLTCAVAGATNDPGPGKGTFYWTNQQGGRLMFFHDHAYGVTRLNVYAGEAAGYLLVDSNVETQLKAATVPGTILNPAVPTDLVNNDVTHLFPLVIQDKTFVPDDGATGGQLAATDPTWPSPANPLPGTTGFGKGSLWFPHVYMPNQNPADVTGANAFGRWDYGPWFWPPQDPSTFVAGGLPYPCTSVAYSATNPVAFPPLLCPGTPNPSGTPEGFMDTPVINGTAYPSLTVDPAAYRFQVLSAGNDRTWNLGLYVADPLSVAVTSGGSGYNPAAPPAVTFTPNIGGAVANAVVSTGQVTSVLVTGVGSGYTGTTPTVTIDPPTCVPGPTCIAAAATAVIDPIVGQVTAINVTNSGAGYTAVPAVVVQDPVALGCLSGCLQATAQAQLSAAGMVLGITVTNPGGPWTSAPAVSIAAPIAGTQAFAIASVNSEVKMMGALPPTATSPLPLCSQATQTGGAQLALATLDPVTGNPINGTGLPAACWPTSWPTDGRDGGVPDPTTAGPPIIQVGTEGGLLPSPVAIPSTPIGYEYNRRSITVLNVFTHGLLLGPAERADVVIDFSRFAGKTLLLYNDGPAPVPAFDPRNDYYTGDPDQTLSGGAPSTLPGYGPNTRTIMQIKVNATATNPNAVTFSLKALSSAQPGIFASTQDRIIVPEPAFPAGNGGAATPTYVRIQDTSVNAWLNGVPVGGLTLSAGGNGYTAAPGVAIAAPTCTPVVPGTLCAQATATSTLRPTSVASFSVTLPGAGYTAAPAVNVTGGGGSGATATATLAGTSVASLTIVDQGRGYTGTSVPITFTPALGGIAARGNISNGRITSITWTSHGSGYTAVPTVTFPNPPCTPLGTTQCHVARATPALAPTSVAAINFTAGGSGYISPPTVIVAAPTCTLNGTTCVQATGSATLTPTSVASLTLTSGGNGYTAAPLVSFLPVGPGSGAAAIAFATSPALPKAIQELFTLDYGRMNATLGVEVPFTNFLTQTTIPYGFIDPPTEIFKNGDIQFWKITHNGVDTHFIHFHLFNVQVINRVGWDGMIKPPDPNEVAWKDTVRMNPLEDVIVALRSLSQTLPWDLPNSIRPLDVTEAPDSTLGFTNIDPSNQPVAVVNDLTNFGYEYVWHCHILGHEENDMMRATSFAVPPRIPTIVSAIGSSGTLLFTDNSLNETGFTIQTAATANGPWTSVATLPASVGAGGQLTYKNAKVIKTGVYVRVVANNLVGYTRTFAAPAIGYPTMSADTPSLPVVVQ